VPLLPILAPLPRRAFVVFLALGVSAWILLCPANPRPGGFPGDPELPYAPVTLNLHWQLHTRGFESLVADDLHGFPFRTDRIVTDGVPLDALASWPLCKAFGETTGMWLFALATVWGAGAAAAWLGMRWWGSLGAGLVAGVGFQVGESVLRELADGRSTQVFAAIFLPLTLGLAVDGAGRARAGSSVAAGLAAGLGTLASWGMAPLLGVAAFGPSLLAGWRRGAVAAVFVLAALAVVVAPAVAWLVAGHGELPSLGTDPWAEMVLALHPVRPVDLALDRLYGADGVVLHSLLRPVLVGVAVWAGWRQRARHLVVPLGFVCVLALLGIGTWLPGPVVAPWGWMQALPGLGRLWWPDRAWIGVALGLSLLAAAAPRKVLPLVALGLFGEALLLSPSWPFGRIELVPAASARVLAEAPDVPLVLLPTGEGALRPDRLDLVDQILHGRPLAGGTRPVMDLTSSDAVLRGWRNNAGLQALLACETGQTTTGAGAPDGAATTALVQAGLREVYLDPRYVGDDAAYVGCVEGVLTGWSKEEAKPLVRYRAP
jgi:hypothetical protein